MNRPAGWSRAAIIVLFAAGCSRAPLLARGPVDVTVTPTVVRFAQPVHAEGSGWEMCFEFNRPGDSRDADRIRATLLGADGGRYVLVTERLDRRGERDVCQLGRIIPDETSRTRLPAGSARTFIAVELQADTPLRLRAIRGAGTP